MKKTIVMITLGLATSSVFGQVVDTGDKVGIGITSPNEKLELNGNLLIRNPRNNGAIILSPSSGGYDADPEFYIQSAETGSGANSIFHISRNAAFKTSDDTYKYIDDAGAEALGISFNSSNMLFNFAPLGTGTINWQTRLFIEGSTGYIGIGTTTPKSKLAVEGQIRATEVKVLADINTVPDYVFEPDYDLLTLKETKEYITENKHLPEIPSAAEIGENGIDLGDMNMRLLKKIEELTLYQIELMEKLEKQNSRLIEVEKELQSIKN